MSGTIKLDPEQVSLADVKPEPSSPKPDKKASSPSVVIQSHLQDTIRQHLLDPIKYPLPPSIAQLLPQAIAQLPPQLAGQISNALNSASKSNHEKQSS